MRVNRRQRRQPPHYKYVRCGYHTAMNVSSKPERTRLSAEDWELAALQLQRDRKSVV